jgi:hypothetical protein
MVPAFQKGSAAETPARGRSHRWRNCRDEPIFPGGDDLMIRRLSSGKFRLYSKKKNPRTGKRKNLGTFGSRAAAEKHERAVQFFKRH